ncbi:MAG: D-sedoheptulose 7-phosphate isomerase [Pseudomonadota bacterium]|nr:D-sedoheptulose 7-phosphate isomerase [Alteromonas sp. ZYF713]MDY6927768.1 D-sedoheptulose 7-phosphate isomerase [Pseudomonadota bacterium]
MSPDIQDEIKASIAVKEATLQDEHLLSQLSELIDACLSSLQQGGKIIFCGNGGSFADAQHLSAEFTSRFLFDRAPLPSLALGTNNSAISAIGNDYGYEFVFSRELQSIATEKDVFVGISTSGNSPNVIAAVEVAKQMNVTTYVLTGQSGGKLKALCNCLCIPSPDTARIQECHILLGHILCGQVEKRYFKG